MLNKLHPVQVRLINLLAMEGIESKSLREIGRLVGLSHPEAVKHHLKQLEKRGFINSVGKVTVSGQTGEFISVPVVGAANAGRASMLAKENIEGYIKLSKSFTHGKKKLFIVRVIGDSMNRAKVNGKSIENGDYVVVNSEANPPYDGKCVISVIDGAANIKLFKNDSANDQIVLLSKSTENHPPILIHGDDIPNYVINGVVIEVIKNVERNVGN